MRAVLVRLNAEQHNVFNAANVAEGWDIAATTTLKFAWWCTPHVGLG